MEPFDPSLVRTALPAGVGPIVDLAPIDGSDSSVWILLAEDGRLIRLDCGTGEWAAAAAVTVAREPDHEPWNGHQLRRRLHVSRDGGYAAIVNDYGRYGQIIDLRTGKQTLALDAGEDDCAETVPFSFAFVEARGRVVAVHRTDWNRLDVSDAGSGELLTARGPTSYKEGEPQPAHYLDYFHGGLHVSPNGIRILDDGWIWHPMGMPMTWSLERWLDGHVWESEDGPTQVAVGFCDYWDRAVAWIDDHRVAIGGIGDNHASIIDGARICDVASVREPDAETRKARELTAFAGPAGTFFSDGVWLYAADDSGLSRWNVETGERTGQLAGFRPTRHHRGARELAQIADGVVVRWRLV